MDTVLCSFDPVAGWRIVGPGEQGNTKIAVVVVEGRKLLSIPVVSRTKPGWFCNPRKLVMKWLHATRCESYTIVAGGVIVRMDGMVKVGESTEGYNRSITLVKRKDE